MFGILRRGDLLGIYPEGTRSPDGRLYKGKTGVARLVLQAGVPVIPVAMIDTQLVPSRFFKIPTMRRPKIRIGKQMDFQRLCRGRQGPDVLRWITDEIMNAVMELSARTMWMSTAHRPRRTWMRARAFRPAPVIVRERAVYAARPDAIHTAEDPTGFGCERVTDQREDSPPAGSETISRYQRRGAPPPRPAQQAALSDDLVSVDRHGNVTVESGSGAGRAIYWALKNVLLGPAITRLFRPIQEGIDNVPDEGPAIVASNHLSFADWLFMPIALDRRITFVAKSDYFTRAGIKGWAQKRFFAGTGQVPIDRSGGRASEGALRAGLKVLQRGELFGIYPEGTRSHDGRLYKGRTGVARLALLSGAPVIPAAIIGTDIIAPPEKILTKIVSPTVKFGRPLDFSRYEGMSEDRFILRSITDEIMYAIMELSGQEYVDMYAPTAKAAAAREAKAQETGRDEVTL